MIRRPFTAVALGLFAGSPLVAQRPHGIELGLYGSLGSYAPRFDLRAGLGGGGRLGWTITPRWELELDVGGQSASTATSATNTSITFSGGSVVANLNGPRPDWYASAGYTRLRFGSAPPGRFADNAVHLGVGKRLPIGPQLALRLDLRELLTFKSGLPGGGAGHLLISAGLSYLTSAGREPDSDHDGVPDSGDRCRGTPGNTVVDAAGCPLDSDADGVADGRDACPNTPATAVVDAHGCPLDADGDLVYDGIDQCPGTAAGAAVDARGCPLDADGDGVPDGIDRCPNTAAGAVVSATGCPLDADRDGVPDGVDRCPGTPPGTPVDATGCSTLHDSDGDGVDDSRDRCPGTAAGTPVDAAGCQILFTPEHTPLVLRGVNFETGKSRLTPESYTVLDQVAGSLIANPDIRIEIAGYTDSTGATATNVRLSNARAIAVLSYLARKGVAPERMRAHGYGPESPVAPNTTPEGRAQNRRVELHQLL